MTDRVYGGSFLELGSYVMLPVLKLFGTEYEKLEFDSIEAENGLDLFTKVMNCFGDVADPVFCFLMFLHAFLFHSPS